VNTREGLNLLDFLATGINKEDPVINAVLSDKNGKGATANELEALLKFINYFTKTDNVLNHKGESLEMIVNLFTKFRRRYNEEDRVLLRRMFALTYRNGDTIWGNVLNLKNIIKLVFPNIECFIAENTNKRSILPGGDFESDDIWTLDGDAVFDYNARFSNMHGLLFYGRNGESCTQIIEEHFISGNYAFHFMLKGKCGVIIKREDGKYWNGNDQIFSGDVVLEWVDDEYINIFDKSDNWDNAFCFLVLPEDINKLTIKFVSIEGETAFIDHVRLFTKPINPSYTIIMQYFGYAINENTLHIGIDGQEPIYGLDYKKESYFDTAFIIGIESVAHRQLLDIILDKVRPCGIQVFIEYIEHRDKKQEGA